MPTSFRSLAIAIALVLACGLATACAAQAEPGVAKVIADLPYYEGADADPDKHRLNLVLPTNGPPKATLLWIHGGAWAAGGRNDEMGLARAFADQGVAVAVMSYRLSAGRWMSPSLPETGVQHPAHMEDVARAFSWLWEHAEDYGLDRNALFVSGFSAGGHMSALLAMDEHYLKERGLGSASIRGAIPVAGAYDIEHYYEIIKQEMGADAARDHVLGVFGPQSGHAAASPSSYMGETNIPMLIIAEGQLAVYTDHFEAQVDSSSNSQPIEFLYFREETHGSLYRELINPNEVSPARDAMLAFIDRLLAE